MSLAQWGGVVMHHEPQGAPKTMHNAKRWRIGNERKTIRDWVRDPRNTLGLSQQAIKCRIWRAENKGLVLSFDALQDPRARWGLK